jgi:hypothetical protein
MNESAARTFRNARREAIFVIVLWFLAFFWTLGYCYLFGYRHAPDAWVVRIGLAEPASNAPPEIVLGLPSWVTYGILAPWLICSVITVLFGLFFMTDDDLGVEREEAPHA